MATTIPVRDLARLIGNPTLTSLDGEKRATLRTILHESWTSEDRVAFGVYLVDITPPEGQRWGGAFEDNDGVPVPVFEPLPPPPVPASISDRQFVHVLAVNGLISQAEALAWVTVGTVPEQIQTVVDNMPDPDIRFGAQMLLSGATIFERHHPMTEALASALGKSPEQTDALWVQGAAL